MLKKRLEHDLKSALLSGDKVRVNVLRGLKSVILYAEVAKGVREAGLSDEETLVLLVKEARKRQESADLYAEGGAVDRATAELAEKTIIEEYLPRQLSDHELIAIINETIASGDFASPQTKGQLIGLVKQKTAGQADGSRIAKFVNERMQG